MDPECIILLRFRFVRPALILGGAVLQERGDTSKIGAGYVLEHAQPKFGDYGQYMVEYIGL